MIRVLVVDDSPTFRFWLRSILESDPDMKVVGETPSGEEAIRLCQKLQPDIITMDILLPGMDGYQAVRTIMEEMPRPVVVLSSTVSYRAMKASFKAMEAGAIAVICKPDIENQACSARDIVSLVKAMAEVKVMRRRKTQPVIPTGTKIPENLGPSFIQHTVPTIDLIAIGASTGGPPAVLEILKGLVPNQCVPIIITVHISKGFVSGMATWFADSCPFRVKVAENGETLSFATAYLAPDDYHLTINRTGQILCRDTPKNQFCPSVDVMFESVAQTYGPRGAGVLLTGMGRDGAQGLKTMRDEGGYTIAQDESSSVVFGMPKEAIALGAALEVLPLNAIARKLMFIMHGND
jgi:two-component system chemotaxis response regulator CheB